MSRRSSRMRHRVAQRHYPRPLWKTRMSPLTSVTALAEIIAHSPQQPRRRNDESVSARQRWRSGHNIPLLSNKAANVVALFTSLCRHSWATGQFSRTPSVATALRAVEECGRAEDTHKAIAGPALPGNDWGRRHEEHFQRHFPRQLSGNAPCTRGDLLHALQG